MEENVIYCGMADDILTPLILVPTLSNLFVIDYFDSAFAKNRTWEGQKEDIKQCLVNGNNKNSHHREVYLKYSKKVEIFYIDEPCEIISDVDIDKCWTLSFKYKDTVRTLTYFHHTNFIANWDSRIKNISHVMCMGAEFPIEQNKLYDMLKERCNADCKFYDQFAKFSNTIYKSVLDRYIFVNDLRMVLFKIKTLL